MKFKKTFLLICVIVCLLSMASACAYDMNDTAMADDDTGEIDFLKSDEIDMDNLQAAEEDAQITQTDNEMISADGDTFTQLQKIINESEEGSVINLTADYQYDSGFSKEGIVIDKALTINGNGYSLDALNESRIFHITAASNVILNNISFKNGYAADGGAIYVQSDLADFTFRDLKFIGNTAENSGGAVNFNNGASSVFNCVVDNCTFTNNVAGRYGGALYGGFAQNCAFIENIASINGGAISRGDAENCTFINNSADSGGAMCRGNAVNCTFLYNVADMGGALEGSIDGSNLAVNCTFRGNSAEYGGAISSADAIGCTFEDNHADEVGGAIYYSYCKNCTFRANSAGNGGAMSGGSALNCTFENNHATYSGGAMGGDGTKATGCIFINNTALNGGAIHQMTADNCTFTGNNATECGGAMYGGVALNSIFTKNHADMEGGAAYDARIANSLFEYNSAGNGGAISGGKTRNSTFSFNDATGYGGGAYNAKISSNSIFKNNTAPYGGDEYNSTYFDSNAKTFTELNELINNSTQTAIYLNDNYTFDLSVDFSLIDGIRIDRDLTVYGNGYTVDGDNCARIFSVKADDVTFRDMGFVNGETSNSGGAIEGYCSVVNCTFRSNHAVSSGGAIEFCRAVDCTFIDNSADGFAGAIEGGYALNCTFINNHASDNAGAIFGGVFGFDNTFVNCTFINNSADRYGGAVTGGSALNCTFINNSADHGGAVGLCDAVNCTFDSNHADSYAGAMYRGTALLCIFKTSSDTISQTEIRPAIVGPDNMSTFGRYDRFLFSLKYDDMYYDGYNVTINVTRNGKSEGVYHALSGADGGWIVDLASGIYNVTLSMPQYGLDPVTVNITVTDGTTFWDLNRTINGNNLSEIVLDKDYLYNATTDSEFGEGILVDREIVIEGNGHVIDADNATRIFSIQHGWLNIVFTNIIFKNGNAEIAGAISSSLGNAVALNCIFENNSADERAGAILYVNAVNCTFINNTAGTNGGAMFGGRVENSTFMGNHASKLGGAIYGYSAFAFNCTFINNTADERGGAMDGDGCYALGCTFMENHAPEGGGVFGTECSVVNSTFINNSADDGGAVGTVDAYVFNCTFINNTAERGGAMFEGSAKFCTFKDNAADMGGAIFAGHASNCTFIANHACVIEPYTGHGGAMAMGDAVNCTFINNTAEKMGGAMIDASAVNCTFTNNHANAGGAMFAGTADNCAFANNSAEREGNDTCYTTFKSVLRVLNFTAIYNSHDGWAVNFTTTAGVQITDANITVRVYRDNVSLGTYNFTSAHAWIVDMDIGTYQAVFSVENQDYLADPVNATLTILKIPTLISSSDVAAVYNGGKYLSATLTDSYGNPLSGVEITVVFSKGSSVTRTTDKNGKVKVTTDGLAPKTYAVEITFNGNAVYGKSAKSVKVTVKKAKSKITAKKKTFKKSKKVKKYTITLKNSFGKAIKKAKVTLKVKGKTFKVKTNGKGKATFKITNLKKKGKFTAAVKFSGNKYYKKATKKVKIKIR